MDSTIYKPRNEDVDIKIRRYQDALSLSGGMVIALTVWDIIKLYISYFLVPLLYRHKCSQDRTYIVTVYEFIETAATK